MKSSIRARRPFWTDLRFLVGVALVVVAIVGVWLIFSAAKTTTTVLQVNRTVPVGEALASSDFQVVDVSLGTATDTYLTPAELTPGMIAARTLSKGELLHAAAAEPGENARTTTIVIETSIPLSDRVATGTTVEVWQAAPKADNRGFTAPEILIARATVADIPEQEGMLVTDSERIELVIDREDVGAALSAISAGAALSVVPLGAG